MPDRYLCRVCSKPVTATKNHRYRTHTDGSGDNCEMSSEPIPEGLEPEDSDPGVPKEGADYAQCPHCSRNVKLTRLGYFEPHETTLRGGERCPNGGVRFRPLKPTEEVPLPGDEIPAKGVFMAARPTVTAQMEVAATASAITTSTAGAAASASEGASPTDPIYEKNLAGQSMEETRRILAPAPEAATSGVSTEMSFPESTSTSKPSPESATGAFLTGPFRLGEVLSGLFLQPASPFLQPTEYTGPERAGPMGGLAAELAVRIKETFYAYDNRKSQDNRSAQTTLGPSEVGTPCDRRLAMALMGVPAVNPGGDGWAAFIGTCGHEGMASVYKFADAGTGRYAVELPVFTGHPTVPRGTTDLLDRRDGTIIDWKFMGEYSLKKFKLEGPSETYRTQAQVYGLGAERGGEVVRNVAVVGLPRAGGSLDDMHVWTEKYDRKFAEAALKRVEDIAQKINQMLAPDAGPTSAMEAAREFPTGVDCRYCPFHLKGDKEMRRGCPGS